LTNPFGTDATDGGVKELLEFMRTTALGFLTSNPKHVPFNPITWDVANEASPVQNVTVGGFFFSSYDAEIITASQPLFNDSALWPDLWTWTTHMGRTFTESTDGAASNQLGAKLYWAMCSMKHDEDFYRVWNQGISKVPTVLFQYWNYKNKYTSEEFSFTYNFDRIRSIRNKYDPQGIFRLPTSKNQGSEFIDTCFAPYHCSGNGKLSQTENVSIPSGGCECTCNNGWTGFNCSTEQTSLSRRSTHLGLSVGFVFFLAVLCH